MSKYSGLIFGKKEKDQEYKGRPAVYGIFVDQDMKIAAVKNPFGFFLPGGGIEEGEAHEQCLKRECIEELGWKIKVGEYMGESGCYYYSPKYEEYHLGIGYFYFAEKIEKIREPIEKDHILQWMDFKEVEEQFFHEHQIWAVKKGIEIKKANT